MHTVLIVDDSPTARDAMAAILSQDADLKVVGVAENGLDALEKTKSLRPDVVTMDILMPVMDGLAATKEIMIECPTPIVIVSASSRVKEVETTMLALKHGALTVMMKPPGPHDATFRAKSRELVNTVKAMADVLVIRHRRRAQESPTPASAKTTKVAIPVSPSAPSDVQVIAIASSTGGPPALAKLLGGLPADFAVPILLVQHIVDSFVAGFAAWLDTAVPMRVQLAVDQERLQPSTVYVAPDSQHLGVSHIKRVQLCGDPAIDGFRPAGTHLFSSVAKTYGKTCAGVILTGMGRDGVAGLADVKAAGGYTIAQDEATSVVFGMPQVAIESGIIDAVLPIDDIAKHLMQLVAGHRPNTPIASRGA